ncbi:MAG: EAL domain-containing protein [Chloroflexi bacterium]|nr:EAL domain-containing protein [Chloroflexota bacterium]
MDDFGTGYSSLGTLHSFPLDAIKIDRTFISNMVEGDDKLTFVRTIVNLARDLGLDVIAEGVETEHQVEQLKALECKFTQGFYYSKAVDSEAALKLIMENQEK